LVNYVLWVLNKDCIVVEVNEITLFFRRKEGRHGCIFENRRRKTLRYAIGEA
jgi:hypothetical protein